MGHQDEAVLPLLAAEIDEDAAFDRPAGGKPKGGESVLHPVGRPVGETGGAVDRKQFFRLFRGIFRVFVVHLGFLLYID